MIATDVQPAVVRVESCMGFGDTPDWIVMLETPGDCVEVGEPHFTKSQANAAADRLVASLRQAVRG